MTEPYFESDELPEGIVNKPFSVFTQPNNPKSVCMEAHWHYYIEILFALSGKGRVVLDCDTYDFKTGDILFINSRVVHSMSTDCGITYHVVKFDPELLYSTTRTVFELKYILPLISSKTLPQKIFTEEELHDTNIPFLISEIIKENREEKYGFELAIRAHIYYLFLWVMRKWNDQGIEMRLSSKIEEEDMHLLQKVFDYLDENYHSQITAKSVASLCNLSYSYFSRKFKKSIGKTFTEYLNHIRLTEAEKLLMLTEKNITEIALDTGFSSSSYFITQFKHYKNVSPKQFRKRLSSVAYKSL